MLKSQQNLLKLSELREKINEHREDTDTEKLGKLVAEATDVERRYRAEVLVEAEAEARAESSGEGAEKTEIRSKTRVGNYLTAAIENRAIDGVEAEFNASTNMAINQFPLELLAPTDVEVRAKIDGENAVVPRGWLDRLFSDSMARQIGVTFESVAPGVASHPITTGGVSAAQRGRTESAANTTTTVSIIEAKPKRNAVRTQFSIEDSARMPGLESALQRDLRGAINAGVDLAIFEGDAGANETTADITGLQTAANVIEKTISQSNKIKGPETLTAFAELIDGLHAATIGDLRVMSSQAANVLWLTTVINSAASNETLAQFLRASGLSWMVKNGIEATTTGNNKFGAFLGRGRGIQGAAVAAMWSAANLVRDPFTEADSGEVRLVLNTLWDFQVVRPTNFARIKFVS